MNQRQRTRNLWFGAAMLLCLACAEETASTRSSAPPDAIPSSTIVSGGRVTEGTFGGKLRQNRDVKTLRASVRPVTVGQYAKCVDARVCNVPELQSGFCDARLQIVPKVDGPTFDLGDADLPVTCASFRQAQKFCNWVGARLPTSIEWQWLGRGADVHRFAWGDSRPTCERHWRFAFAGDQAGCCGASCSDLSPARVGSHPGGASPFGIEDVLSTRSELVAGDEDALWPSCRDEREGCVVTGTTPGAIDSFLPPSAATHGAAAPSFRCVWGNG